MKKQLLTVAIATIASSYASAYQFEVGAGLGQGEVEAGNVSNDYDAALIYGELHFEQVDTSKGPLAEAAFLDKSSFIDFSLVNIDPDNGDDTDNYGFGGRFVTDTNLILEASYDQADDGTNDADTFGFGIGTYINDTTDVVVSYSTTDDDASGDLDVLDVQLHSIQAMAQGASVAFDLGASVIDAEDDDGFGVNAGATYYFNNMFGIGLSAEFVDVDSYERDTISLDLSYFVAPNVEVAFSYFDTTEDYNGPELDTDGFLIGVAGRF